MAKQTVDATDTLNAGRGKINDNFTELYSRTEGINFSFSTTAPTSTNVAWVDTGNASMQAYPIRYYINGAWTPVTDECDWYDTIGGVVSKGKPIAILFSGQSNVGHSSYYPNGEPTYTGDITINKYVSLWQPATNEFKVFEGTLVTSGNRTWTYPAVGGGTTTITDPLWGYNGLTNQLWVFGKLYAKAFNRSVRFVGTRRGGQPLAQWEATKLAYTELTSVATNSGVPKFSAFIWIHGEAGLNNTENPSAFTTYKDSFYDLIGRLRAQSWGGENMLVIMPSHALNYLAAFTGAHQSPALSPNGNVDAEGTARSLDNQDSPYSGWAAAFFAREVQNGATDPYHFTSREMERFGAAIYATFLSLPNYKKGDRLYRVFYTNAGNRLTSVKAVLPNTNDFEVLYTGGGSTTPTWKRTFSASNDVGVLAGVREVVSGTSANYAKWQIDGISTAPGTLEEKISVDANGVHVPKLLNVPGSSEAGVSLNGGVVFINAGSANSINNMWIAKDAANPYAITYKSSQSGFFEGAHQFYLGNTIAGKFFWTAQNTSSVAFDVSGDVRAVVAGKGFSVKEGANAKMGTATLVAGSVVVSNTSVTANSRIMLTTQTPGGTIGVQYISARTAGTSFTITSTSNTDTSTIAYLIIEPN